jgi:hypothetical protein
MSATIYWRPIAKRSGYIDTHAPSAFMRAIREAFGREMPARFRGEDIPVLKGMVAVELDKHQRSAYQQMIDEIEKNGAIELWAEY